MHLFRITNFSVKGRTKKRDPERSLDFNVSKNRFDFLLIHVITYINMCNSFRRDNIPLDIRDHNDPT
jgi:hypothetical protein